MRWLLVLVTGCALTSRSTPMQIRYFSPIPAASTKQASPPMHASTAPEPRDLPRIRIGSVTPSDHLREDIARRTSPFELELYSTRRWTEPWRRPGSASRSSRRPSRCRAGSTA